VVRIKLPLQRRPWNLLLVLSVLACAATGCTTEVRVRPDEFQTGWEDVTVGVGLDLDDAAAHPPVAPDRPLVSIDVAGARVERMHSGDGFLVLAGRRQIRLEPLDDGSVRELPLGLGAVVFIAEPLAEVPAALARSLENDEGLAREDAAAVAVQLLR
jgi:hypothetical protein